MPETFRITRTNTKRYVGHCQECTFTTNVESIRQSVAIKMRDHARQVHGREPGYLNKYLEPSKRTGQNMKAPNKELPPGERLSDYIDHLCVFGGVVSPGTFTSQNGNSECDAQVWVYVKGAWKSLGNSPIWWAMVARELEAQIGPDTDDKDETVGAYLRRGGNPTRAGDFYWLEAAQDKPDLDLLKKWDKDHAEAF